MNPEFKARLIKWWVYGLTCVGMIVALTGCGDVSTAVSVGAESNGNRQNVTQPTSKPKANENVMVNYDEFMQFCHTLGRSDGIPDGVFMLGEGFPVVRQPPSQADYVSAEDGVFTYYNLPAKNRSDVYLVHNYLSPGDKVMRLEPGNQVDICIDGIIVPKIVTEIKEFQALAPSSPFSNFVEQGVKKPSIETAAQVFDRVYTPETSVFQTCIEENGEPGWGRRFVIAK